MKENLLLLNYLQIYEFNTKDIFIDKLADIVHKYNNTYYIEQLK